MRNKNKTKKDETEGGEKETNIHTQNKFDERKIARVCFQFEALISQECNTRSAREDENKRIREKKKEKIKEEKQMRVEARTRLREKERVRGV